MNHWCVTDETQKESQIKMNAHLCNVSDLHLYTKWHHLLLIIIEMWKYFCRNDEIMCALITVQFRHCLCIINCLKCAIFIYVSVSVNFTTYDYFNFEKKLCFDISNAINTLLLVSDFIGLFFSKYEMLFLMCIIGWYDYF